MKKTLLSLGLVLLSLSYAYCQNYVTYSSFGTKLPFLWNGNNITTTPIIGAPNNDVLSASQTIPFSWTFYGQAVTSYKASDNGYITFDNTASTSDATSMALPSASAPKNAIFAYWTDLEVKTSTAVNASPSVRTWTYGSAPNRVHVIEWYYVSPKGSALTYTNFLMFSIRLYEAGGFDIVHTSDIITSPTNNALIGAQNADASLAVMAAGSPTLGAPNPNGTGANATDLVYIFKPVVNQIDAGFLGANLFAANKGVFVRGGVPHIIKGDNLSFSGSIINFGSSTINSYDVNYSINGDAPVTKHVSGASLVSGGIASISVTPWNVTGEGTLQNIDLWISNINGIKDQDSSNNSFSATTFVLAGNNATSKPLVEEGSGAWCGYCPDGHRIMTQIIDNNPNTVGLVYHYQDYMSTPEGDTHNSEYLAGTGYGFPYAMVNRTIFPDVNPDAPMNRDKWQAAFIEANQYASVPVKLDIMTKSFDPYTRQIKFTVTVTTTDYIYGDLRLNSIVKEDKVRGNDIRATYVQGTGYTPSWTQHNYYSSQFNGGIQGNPLYNEDEWLIGYFHNHVVEKMLTGADGVSLGTGIIAPNTTYTKDYTWTLPPTTEVTYSGTTTSALRDMSHGYGQFNPWNIKLVAFASLYSSDKKATNVLNATEVPLVGWSDGVAKDKEAANAGNVIVYPNPSAGLTNLAYTLDKSTDVTIEIYDVMGRNVQTLSTGIQTAGDHLINFDTDQFNNGLYSVVIKSNGNQTTKEFMVQK
jgi:hypothetical protein